MSCKAEESCRFRAQFAVHSSLWVTSFTLELSYFKLLAVFLFFLLLKGSKEKCINVEDSLVLYEAKHKIQPRSNPNNPCTGPYTYHILISPFSLFTLVNIYLNILYMNKVYMSLSLSLGLIILIPQLETLNAETNAASYLVNVTL